MNRKILLVVGLMIIIGCVSNTKVVYADIIKVSGNVSGTWLKGNIYVATETITINVGETLIIQPGVIVKFRSDILSKVQLNVKGKLIAQGNEREKIIFTSLNDDIGGDTNGTDTLPAVGDWGGIHFIDVDSEDSILEYCIIRYTWQYGISITSSSIFINNSAITDVDFTVTHGGYYEIKPCYGIYVKNGTLSISNSTISNISTHAWGGREGLPYTYGIYMTDSKCEINNCIISIIQPYATNFGGNTGYGIYGSSSIVTINNSNISQIKSEARVEDTFAYGGCFYSSSFFINNSKFVKITATSGWGGNAFAYGIYSSNSLSGSKVTKSDIFQVSGKTTGIGICLLSSQLDITMNNIYDNNSYNLLTDISPGTQTAEYNWWGADPPNVAKFSGNIDYEPWLRAAVPKITIVPSSEIVGTIITVSGEDFGSTELIQIDFGTTRTITTVTTTSSGTFATTFIVDTQPYGTKTISAVGLNTGVESYDMFFVRANIILLTPTMGTIGSFVSLR